RRAALMSASRRRYQRQDSSTSRADRKKTAPTSTSITRPLQAPKPRSAAPSNASTAAATIVRARDAVGDTGEPLADRAAAARQNDQRSVRHQAGGRKRYRLTRELGPAKLDDV